MAGVNFDTTHLVLSFAVGAAGFVAFSYGKSQRRVPQMAIGLILMVFPYFVDGVIATLAVTVGLLALLWFAVRLGW